MALTRATGKAFRLGFSWIISLAGYETTPAEEMEALNAVEYHEPESAAQPAPKMSLESASAVVNREGVKYVDLDSEKLGHMRRALVKSLKDNNLSAEDKTEHEYKRDAIDVILASRNGG